MLPEEPQDDHIFNHSKDIGLVQVGAVQYAIIYRLTDMCWKGVCPFWHL